MPLATTALPLQTTIEPADPENVAAAIREAYETETPVYPIGGGTCLGFGLPAKREGVALSLGQLNRVVDYPARDMTITLEAGATMAQLAETLAAERQQLPVDVPRAERATIGGVIATNWNGPRRYGYGSLRDFVIGISAVDGRGTPFHGGGRVVKNVAGYDFCKLLTGSLGTLAVITQVTLKLRPLPERSVLMACELADEEQAERMLAALVHSATTPAAIELLAGPAWMDAGFPGKSSSDRRLHLVVGLEGTEVEVAWMQRSLADEWKEKGVSQFEALAGEQASDLWRRLAEFPVEGDSPLVLKASLAPSGTAAFIRAARQIDDVSIQAHAGNGVVLVRFAEFPTDGLSRTLIGRLQPVAAAHHGHVVVLSNPSGAETTRQAVWGGSDAPFPLMTRIKQKFDPKDILNPGRFVYP